MKKRDFIGITEPSYFSSRSYYVIKCLMQNIGECVSQMQIEEFLKDHGENIGGGNSIDSGIRNYISRLRKVGFDHYIVNCPRGRWLEAENIVQICRGRLPLTRNVKIGCEKYLYNCLGYLL